VPPIEREKVKAMLSEAPPEQHEAILQRLAARGFTVSDAPAAAAPAEEEQPAGPSLGHALIRGVMPALSMVPTPTADAATDAALETPIPGLKQAHDGLSAGADQAQNYYAALGVPRIGKAVGMGGRFMAGVIPPRMKDALFIAAAGPAMEIVATGLAPVARAGGNLLADVAGAIAGKDPEVVKVLFNRPGAIWNKAKEVFTLKHQEALTKELGEGLAAQGAKFKELEDAFAGFHADSATAPKVDLAPARTAVQEDMVRSGHRVPEELTGKAPIGIGRIAADAPEYKMLVEKLMTMKNSPNLPFGEALNFRRQIGDMMDMGVEGSNGMQPVSDAGNRVLKKMYAEVNKSLDSAVPKEILPEWKAANKAYSEARDAYSELRRQVVGTTPRQTEHKLLQMIQEGRYDDEVLSRAQKLGAKAKAAMDAVRDHLAAKEFKRWATGGMKTGALLPSSPRAIGYGVAGAGGLSQAAQMALANPKASVLAAQGFRNLAGQPPTPSSEAR
jgi:hypothetical protein